MGTHMKTTIDLSEPLFDAVKALAQSQQTTMKALIEDGLRRVLLDAKASKKPAFKLKNASVRGGQMLIDDPRKWQEMESDAIAKNIVRTRK
jgi:hypothetical protein